MQYHIQTAPIWDAFKENDGCPLCKLYARAESRLVKQYLGEAVMEPDYRVRVNERGFCDKHLVKLYDGNNKLGLALQLHTRTEHIIKCIDVPLNAKQARKLADRLEKTANTCVICDEVDEVMNRYYYKHIGLNIPGFWRHISHLLPAMVLPTTVAVLLAVFVHPATYWQLIPPGLLFVAVYAASMWLFGMNRYERGLVTGPLRRILHRQ